MQCKPFAPVTMSGADNPAGCRYPDTTSQQNFHYKQNKRNAMNRIDKQTRAQTSELFATVACAAQADPADSGIQVDPQRALPIREQELLIFRMDFHLSSNLAMQYVTSAMGQTSLSRAELYALSRPLIWPQVFSERDRVVLSFCDEMNDQTTVSDDTWNRCHQMIGATAMIDLVRLVSHYALHVLGQVSRREQLTRRNDTWPEYS
jgi:hypothetical protein